MAEAAKKPTVRRKRKRGRPRDEAIYYVFEIERWDWSFWFGVSNSPERNGPYDDYRHLTGHGKLIAPRTVKTVIVELHFLPDRRLNEGAREHDRPIGIGSLSVRAGQAYGYFSMPADALPSILTMTAENKIRYVIASGDKLRYGSARMKSFRLQMDIDEDDLPAEE